MTDVFTWLLLLVPASALSAYFTSDQSLLTFLLSVVAVIPLAEWIRRATEHLAERAGPAIGGLLNVSFGNTAELVLALFVLAANKPDVVKAQITGAIIGNSLLGLGLAIVVGSIGRANLMGHPMDLVFSSPLELVAIGAVVFAVTAIAQDGETTWFEGVMLLAIYLLLALTFYFV